MKKYLLIFAVIFVVLILAYNLIEVNQFSRITPKKPTIDFNNSIIKTVDYYVDSNQHIVLNEGIVFMNFWGFGCPPCFEEMSMLNNIMSRFSSDSIVNFVSFCENADVISADSILNQKHIDFNFDKISYDTGLLPAITKIAYNNGFKLMDKESTVLPTTTLYSSNDDELLFFKQGKLSNNDSTAIVSLIKENIKP